MTRDTELDELVFDAMERQGGGFVAHLGQAWRRADPVNYAKLMSAFGDCYRQYQAAAERQRSES